MKKTILHIIPGVAKSSEKWLYNLLTAANNSTIHYLYDLKSNIVYTIKPEGIVEYRNSDNNEFLNPILKKLNDLFRIKNIGLEKLILKLNIDIIHVHFAPTACDIMNQLNGIHILWICSFYGYDYDLAIQKYPKYRALYERLYLSKAYFFSEGEYGQKKLKSRVKDPIKVWIQKLGVDTEKIPFFNKEKHKNHLKIVQVANFLEKKGQLTSIQVVKLLSEHYPNISLTLVGSPKDSDYYNICKDEAKDSPNIQFLDFVDYWELHNFLGDFDVFLQPSQYTSSGDNEGGAPTTLLDAQATGLPIVATDHCDISSYVVDGITGFLSSEKDINQLRKNLFKIYQMNTKDYLKMSQAAREHIEEKYNLKKNAASLEEHYDAIIQTGSSPET